jgi:hypothetical protein
MDYFIYIFCVIRYINKVVHIPNDTENINKVVHIPNDTENINKVVHIPNDT